jgi:DNA-binding MarR family transcriptional regulator
MPAAPDPNAVVIPALLRAARGAYAAAIRSRLIDGGFADLPRNAPFVLGGLANHGGSAGELVRGLGISKQAASQLVDVLVVRGYLVRAGHPEDRRRITVELTERGRAAAAAIRAGVVSVDEQLAELCSPRQVAGLRAGLSALAEIRERLEPWA